MRWTIGLFLLLGSWLLAVQSANAQGAPWEGYYCVGGPTVAMRIQLVSLTPTQVITRAAKKPGAMPERIVDTLVARTANSISLVSADNRAQTITRRGDEATLTEGKVAMPMFKCDWLLDDGVFYNQYKTLSLKNFGGPECRDFVSSLAAFANDANSARTGSLTGTLLGRGVNDVSICRILPLPVAKARKAMAQAMLEAGLQLQVANMEIGQFSTTPLDKVQAGIGPAFQRPFIEQFDVAVTPADSQNSRVVITRRVIVKAPDNSWMRMSSDGYKEHWLLTNTMRLASLN